MALRTLAAISAAFNARYPNAGAAVLDSVSASAEPATLDSVQAMAVKGFAAVNGNLQFVQAKEYFFVGGELISKGDFVQVTEGDAKRLVNASKADLASDADVAAAQKATK